MRVRVGEDTAQLSVEDYAVVAEAALYHALVAYLQQEEQRLVPSRFQWHELVIMYLHDVVAEEPSRIFKQPPQHRQSAEFTSCHVTFEIDVARTSSPVVAVRHQHHVVSQLLKALSQRRMDKARLS